LLPAVKDEHRLTATFQLPCLNGKYRKKAEEYLAHFVGHEGSGSLLSALKARGWASELSAGVGDQSSVAWLFEVSITLTEAGLTAGPGECVIEHSSRA
jgi:nardilysin